MLAVTDQILTDVIKNIFDVKCVFGHEDRVAKQFYNIEDNILTTDFAILFRNNIELNQDIKVGHIHGKQGFDIYKNKTNFDSLVWRYIPVIINYELKFFLNSRFKMNDIIRSYYFLRYSPNITININDIFSNFEIPENFPATFNITIRNNDSVPEDSTEYYAGDDNLVFKLTCPLFVESILLSPEVQPLINHVNLNTTIYNHEHGIDDKESTILK